MLYIILLLVAVAGATSPPLHPSVPPQKCSANETLAYCKAPCITDYCPTSANSAVPQCSPPNPCHPGCICLEGFKRRNDDDSCIAAEDCPPITCDGKHEFWNPCASYCDKETCDALCNDDDDNVACPAVCVPKCQCEPGYCRNKDGVCVKAKKCIPPQKCSANETLAYCKAPCITDYCPTSANSAVPQCSPPNPCHPGCICLEGFKRRNDDDSCIAAEDCPPITCDGQHEFWNPCASYCDKETCDARCNDDDDNVVCPAVCVPKCQCETGYCRNKDGVCVKAEKCVTSQKCAANETLSDCKAPCITDYCPTRDNSAVPQCSPPNPCLPGCVCQEGFKRRNEDDKCIATKDCPQITCRGKHEMWNPCASYCDKETCDALCNDDDDNVACPAVCVPKCQCEPGYCKNKDKVCVKAPKCPSKCND